MPPRSPDSAREIIASGLCIGCGACAAAEGMRWDRYGQLKPVPATAKAGRSLAATCPFSPDATDEDAIAAARFPAAPVSDPLIGRFAGAWVGHVEEGEWRAQGSSGGMVSWVAAELIRQGLVDAVAHVAPCPPDSDGAFFRYRVSRSVAQVGEGAKSRYHPVHLAGVLDEIRRVPGRYAVVGVPCFIKAVHLLRAQEPVLAERIRYTLGLFCGHMKSRRFVDSFAWQLGAERQAVRAVEYRRKDPQRPANWYTAHLTLADGSTCQQDWWHLADGDWGAGYFQNSACDMCDDVVAETADIAFGDAWVEPYSSDGRGTNVVIARHPRLLALVEQARAEDRLALEAVDAGFIARTQDAGLRHRREGLAYRLTWRRHRRPGAIRPLKRVRPSAALPWRRKIVYRLRAGIARWSHRLAWLALTMRRPSLYLRWARLAYGLYEGATYSRGRFARMFDALTRRRDTGA